MIIHSEPTRTDLANVAKGNVDIGTGTAKLDYLTSSDVVVSSHDLPNPAYVGDNCTHPDALSIAIGLITKFKIYNRNGDFEHGGTVGLAGSGEDIERSVVNITTISEIIKGGILSYVPSP